MNKESSRRPDQGPVVRLYEQIARLHATIQTMRTSLASMEDDRQQLLLENRRLRRQLTQSALMDEMKTVPDGGSESGDEVLRVEPPQLGSFYRRLPVQMSVPAFFRIAQEELDDPGTAGRCLMYYFRRGLLDWTGAHLEKPESARKNGNGRH